MSNLGKRFKTTERVVQEKAGEKTAGSREIGGDASYTALYIADLADELRNLAEDARMPFLAYLLDLAKEEAQLQIHRQD